MFRKKNPRSIKFEPIATYTDEVIEDDGSCQHLFMPLDSTNENFACRNCGLIVPKEQLKNKNIFENKSF